MNRTLRKLGCLVTASTLIVSMAACSSKAPDKPPETLTESAAGAQTAGENSETKESTSDTKQPTDSINGEIRKFFICTCFIFLFGYASQRT